MDESIGGAGGTAGGKAGFGKKLTQAGTLELLDGDGNAKIELVPT